MMKFITVAVLAAIFVGCAEKPTEAQLFGYKGRDIRDSEDKMFFSTGPGVTNWVPARALSVLEMYEFSTDELSLVKAAGIIQPAKSLKEIPAGYVEKAKEPWFVTWTKEVESFGKRGSCGFVSHWDEAKKIWETGETYFSTYYPTEAEAVKALGELELELAKFNPKKFHKFDKCWIAEYVRLRVMGLAGQRPDGTWTCMLDIQDKCASGCGQWEPVEVQQYRIDEIAFQEKMDAWRKESDKLVASNHEAVLAKAKSRKLSLFGSDVQPQPTDDGRMVYVRGSRFSMSNIVQQTVWNAKAAELEKASGAKLAVPSREDYEGKYSVWYAMGSNDLFTIRLDIAFPIAPANSTGAIEIPGEWRQLCFENLLPENMPPPAPQRKH